MNNGGDAVVALEPVKSNGSCVRVLFQFHESVVVRIRTAADLGLKIGLVCTEAQIADLMRLAALDAALDMALRHLQHKARTTMELQTYLQRRGAAADVATEAVERLQARGLVDDATYVHAYLEQKRHKYSRRELRAQLQRRGLQFPTSKLDDGADQSMDAERVAALAAAVKFCRTHPGLDSIACRTRLSAHLQRRGFPGGLIRDTLRQVKSLGSMDDEDFDAEPRP